MWGGDRDAQRDQVPGGPRGRVWGRNFWSQGAHGSDPQEVAEARWNAQPICALDHPDRHSNVAVAGRVAQPERNGGRPSPRQPPEVCRTAISRIGTDPGHMVASRLSGEENGYGGIFSVRLLGGEPAMACMVENCKLVIFATSLGETSSLAWPIFPTDVLRRSIGIEDEADIIADLDAALGVVKSAGF